MKVIKVLLLLWMYFGAFTTGVLAGAVSPWCWLLLPTVPGALFLVAWVDERCK